MNSRFEIKPCSIPELNVITRKPLGDNRGYLERMFCVEALREILCTRQIEQINHTLTQTKGTVRGMHFQHPPHAEMKFVSCLHGSVFDVAVDIRKNSPTFLHWHAEILSAENHKSLVIPEGFAHGFQTLTDHCEMLYLHTTPYASGAEAGLNPQDLALAIEWPLPFTEISLRDTAHPAIGANFKGITL